MFEKYFQEQSKLLQQSFESRLEKKGISPPSEKDLKLFKEFYDFIKDHIPIGFSLAMGKIRNKTHVFNKSCDLIIYKKWCKNFLRLTGGFIPVDQTYAFFSLENDLTTDAIVNHINFTQSIKTMYAMDFGISEDEIVPAYSILFAYKSRIPLLSHKLAIIHSVEEKEISFSHSVDLVCVLDQGIIIKDWQHGIFKIIETKEDTLMWFYILLIEFLDRNNELNIDLRSFLKEEKQYAEK